LTLRIKNIEVPANIADPDAMVRSALIARLSIDDDQLSWMNIRKKSLDARKKSRIVYHYQVDFDVQDRLRVVANSPGIETVDTVQSAGPLEDLSRPNYRGPKPVIVGSGPAGIFAALVMAEAGVPAVIVERGEPVESRLRTVSALRRGDRFDDNSNYCYGEGGAGTFSDGKLSCGRNHPLIRYLFDEWVRFGAPAEILYDAHPHIGTDYLLIIAKRMRSYLETLGCEFIFNKQLVDFNESADARFEVLLNSGESIATNHLVLAIGHSARDTYELLVRKNLAMAPKPFAIGARFEHPQDLINKIQFGSCQIGTAAEYKLVAHAADRGIWTFCMCPGGHLLPTGAQQGHLAINGMSYHARNSGFANAAVVVNVQREDFYRSDILDGVRFQQAIERRAFDEGGGSYSAPAQRISDFIKGKKSRTLGESTYRPGISSARLDHILPEFVVNSLRVAMIEYDKKMRGYLSDAGMVVGVETKTSSPIVMMRDKVTLQSTSHQGMFPAGEGAGFAGGIVSAALDGVRTGRAVIEDLIRSESSCLSQRH
jgi:uncharacterized FAD-dependent dehydrogenase